MYPLIRCPTCNSCIGSLLPAYVAMKKKMVDAYLASQSDALGAATEDLPAWKLEIYADMHVETGSLLDALDVKRVCCRSVIITNSNHDDLVYA